MSKKLVVIIFSTCRYEYLYRTLSTMHKYVDFGDLDVEKILIDDYPQKREDQINMELCKRYGIAKLVKNPANFGLSQTWANVWKYIKETMPSTNYIWHQEDDFEFTGDVKVKDMINALESGNYYQVCLRRNIWYTRNVDDYARNIIEGKIGIEKKAAGHDVVDLGKFKWFLPHPGVYPKWVLHTPLSQNPQESSVANSLHKNYPQHHCLIFGKRDTELCCHIGDYNQGSKVLPGENSWGWQKGYQKHLMYDSKGFMKEVKVTRNYEVSKVCKELGLHDLEIKYLLRSVKENTDNIGHRYMACIRLYHLRKDKSYLSVAQELLPERTEAWYYDLLNLDKKDPETFNTGYKGWEYYLKYRYEPFFEKDDPVYDYKYILEFGVVCYYNQKYELAYSVSKEPFKNPPQQIATRQRQNIKYFIKKLPIDFDQKEPVAHAVDPAELTSIESYTKAFEEQKVEVVSYRAIIRDKIKPSPLPTSYGCSAVIIDNFLPNPDQEREFALCQEFSVVGNYPGKRTQSFATEQDKKIFERILGKRINYWPKCYNGSYQITTKKNYSWIHRDGTFYSAIIFLTPNAPKSAGTTIYWHKKKNVTYASGDLEKELNAASQNYEDWEKVDVIGNLYNRLIIFCGKQSHQSSEYFGEDHESGRLFKVFFFNVEN